jgi:hypothetical protein
MSRIAAWFIGAAVVLFVGAAVAIFGFDYYEPGFGGAYALQRRSQSRPGREDCLQHTARGHRRRRRKMATAGLMQEMVDLGVDVIVTTGRHSG